MFLRTLKTIRNRRYWSPPDDATHVLQWLPSALMVPDPGITGWWEIQSIGPWLAGEPEDDAPDEDGPADRAGDDLRGFVDACFGEDATLIPFEVEIETGDGDVFTTPAYWLIPGGGW